MNKYYDRDGITIYHGDCLEILPTLPPDSIDLLVTDPPWGVKWQSHRRAELFGQMAGDGDMEIGDAAVRLGLTALRDFRHLYVFGPFQFDGLPVGGFSELVWDKAMCGMGDLSLPWGPGHERIAFGVKVKAASGRKRGDGRLSARLRKGSILRHARPNGTGVRHPSEKPLPLIREIIESSSCIGETVLDPFGGSFSTAVAALLEGRKAIVIEKEEKWCELGANRLRAIPKIEEVA